MSLVFFDIDGTLLLSGRAGVRAMTRAFTLLFNVPDGFSGIQIAGNTDTYLLSRALQRAGVSDTPERHAEFRDTYLALLTEEIRQPGEGPRGVMPGITEILGAARNTPGFHLALITGNYQPAAQIKLAHFGLAEFFHWGAFGEESTDRDELARLAMQRARDHRIPEEAQARTVIIGDTPQDIACARAIGARSLAVATGSFSVAELTRAGAEMVLPDLRDTERVLELLR